MSQLYPSMRETLLGAQWLTGVWKALLLPEAYNPDFDDTVLADVFSGVRLAISEEIENRTATNGYAMCDPIRFGILVDTRKATSLILFKDTGDEATSPLLAFITGEHVFGAPVTLDGREFFFVPSSVDGGIFRL